MSDHVVAEASELSPGDRLVVQLEGKEIGVFRFEDGFKAYLNWCPHQGGPICEGGVTGTVESTFDRETLTTETEWVREGEVLNCPWHGWEFDVTEGSCLSREKVKLPSYPVSVEDGQVVVSL